MGTIGEYLRNGREARGVDIREAAQQTRIGINYLKALEEEDFLKLPGEVFVKGFLKSYVRFLRLDDAEAMKRYAEMKPVPAIVPEVPAAAAGEKKTSSPESKASAKQETPIEPFIWGAIIFISLLVILFTSLPLKEMKKGGPGGDAQTNAGQMGLQETVQPAKLEKLYLEVIALEDTWLLVRTDTSPQKKAVLKKGESLIWSADERFLLTYSRVSDVKLLLNGEELAVRGTRETTVRDLAVTRTGIVNQPAPEKIPQPLRVKAKPAVQRQQVTTAPAPAAQPAASPVAVSAPAPAASAAAPAPDPVSAPVPAPAPAPASDPVAPATAPVQ
jgi:hypothetical protein